MVQSWSIYLQYVCVCVCVCVLCVYYKCDFSITIYICLYLFLFDSQLYEIYDRLFQREKYNI